MAERRWRPGAADGGGGVGATGMWTFLATDAMGFGGLLIAYGVLRVRAGVDTWPDPRARLALAPAAAMTFALLPSSLTMTLATRARDGGGAAGLAARDAGARRRVPGGRGFEYAHLLGGAPAMGLTTDLFASTFYVVTGFHALHVFAGAVAVSFMLRAKVGAQALETTALYWHFVDAAWMPIFSIIYLWPAR